jgi:ABC-type nitrate/sulfonate/bicarbonate transport system substrate-binding protein
VNPVIAEPPFDTGAVQDTVANALPATAETPVGAPGTVAGVTEADAEESEELPTAFVAFTVNVRGVPLVRPVKLAVRTLPTVNGVPGVNPTYGVTVYAVIADPPEAGAVQETVAVVLPATAETPVGASGTVTGVTDDDAIESKELP